jgi:hypothetical protein
VVDAFLSFCIGLMEPAIGALPSMPLGVGESLGGVGGVIRMLDQLAPVQDVFTFSLGMLFLFPALFGARVAVWIFGMIRGGGGT